MSSLLARAARLDRAILIRHVALCLATAATFLWPFSVRTTNRLVWIVALVISVNFVVDLMWHAKKASRAAPILSTFLGILGWLALGASTGGAESPFIAGFWLEILLSALTLPWLWTLGVSAAAMAGITSENLIDPSGSTLLLGVHCAFLAAMGVVTALLSRRWQSANRDLLWHQEELKRQLGSMEKELRASRDTTAADESSARLAHGIKNAVHALRGFAALAREPAPGEERSRRAWDGLSACIDRLDETTRFALRRDGAPAGPEPASVGIGRTIEEVIREASLSYTGIRWERHSPEVLPRIAAPPNVVREALLNLARNAAEAMGGEGDVVIEARVEGAFLEIAIRDQGAGIAPSDLGQLFMPGRSTKPDGSGLGLFLTQRLIEAHGGFVRAVSTGARGARFSMGLPVLER
jgi:signal transduction histidine kinase